MSSSKDRWAGILVVTNDNAALLGSNPRVKWWTNVGGGKMDPQRDSSFEEAARREFKEETLG
jgi:8-oxo-dGTP pyrophosphatase MutT (NUDIX family)